MGVGVRMAMGWTYTAEAVHFDGSTYLEKTGGFSGGVNSHSILLSFWFKIENSGSEMYFLIGAGGYFALRRGSTNRLALAGSHLSDWASGFDVRTIDQFMTGWHHVLFSTNGTDKHCYIDGVSHIFGPQGVYNVGTADVPWSSTGSVYLGASVAGTNPFIGDIADLYYAPGQYLDLSVQSNREKFIKDQVPVSLGDGSSQTGTKPLILMTGGVSGWATNKGTGGDFPPTTGSLSAASTNPTVASDLPDVDLTAYVGACANIWDVPTQTYKSAIDTFIKTLKTADLWQKLDRYWLVGSGEAYQATVDFVGRHLFTFNNGYAAFVSGKGFISSVTSHIDSNFIPSADGVNYTLDSASFGGYVCTDKTPDNTQEWGAADSSAWQHISTLNAKISTYAGSKINVDEGGDIGSAYSGTVRGSWITSRHSHTSASLYRDGLDSNGGGYTGTVTATGVPNSSFCIGGTHAQGSFGYYSDARISTFFAGGGLSDSEALALYNAEFEMLTTIGVIYTAQGINFDGSTNYLSKASALSSVSNGKLGTISFWFRLDATGDGTLQYFVNTKVSGGNRFLIRRDADNSLYFTLRDVNGTDNILLYNSQTLVGDSSWHHLIASWDTGNNYKHMYLDGTNILSGSAPALIDANLPYLDNDAWGLLAMTDGTNKFKGDVADFYFNTAAYLDLSSATTLAKFIDDDGRPVSLGSDGSRPTGSSPAIYLHGLVSSWETNDGVGGDFTENGTLSAASSNP